MGQGALFKFFPIVRGVVFFTYTMKLRFNTQQTFMVLWRAYGQPHRRRKIGKIGGQYVNWYII